ncbi:MAG: Nif3-like dinuclear metal center hexameric protein [Lachnospiraceae bacterium]|nr:Nif3-like dinuclear metal center hexameric protein [Lachnospiraceae bacterium]
MGLTISQFEELLGKQSPKGSALSWDNVGLLVGSEDWNVETVFIALDATDEAIDQAIDAGADLIITHHPMIFKPIGKVTDQDYIGHRVMKLVENHIGLFAMHTNFDIHGMNDLARERLGLHHTVILDVCETDEDGREYGIGCIGSLDDSTVLVEYAKTVRDRFGLSHVKVFGDPAKPINVVALSPGSGKGEIDVARSKGADVLVTGDIDHHSGIDSVEKGMAIIDAGHYGIEYIFIEYIANYIEEKTKGIKVCKAEKKEPFWLV